MKTTTRQTLSLSFAIFIAIDYFIEYWKGLGGMVQAYYSRLGFDQANHGYMLLTIGIAAVLGVGQVLLNDLVFNKLTEFRRHY